MQPSQKKNKYLRTFLAYALTSASLFQLALPTFALTEAGTLINNTATAEYEDPNNPGQKIKTESNQVTITVAEVAGLTNIAQTPVDINGGSVISGDTIQFPFNITNTGNETTNVFIPNNINDITTSNFTITRVLVDTDGDGTPEVYVPDASGDLYLDNGNFDTPMPLVSTVDPQESFTVTVEGTVAASLSAGTTVSVQLGNTGSNNSDNADSQNQPDNGVSPDLLGANNEVRSTGGAPVNGQREAADTSNVTVGQAPLTPLALPIIKKTHNSVVINNPTSITDDNITYNLELDVSDVSPDPNVYDPADLEGTPIDLDGSAQTKILVSDLIPEGTQLKEIPTAPAGWTVVYSTDDPATAKSAVIFPDDGTGTYDDINDPGVVNWITIAPSLASIKRIGFIKIGTQLVTAGTTVTGFNFTVTTTGASGTSYTIDNIAQVFGQTAGGNNNVVFDESGDDNPANFDDNNNPDPFEPATNDGIADGGTDGIDGQNNNTGIGNDGEVNRVVITVIDADLLNGPNGTPDAVGPGDDNDLDFQNQSLPASDFNNRTINPNNPELTTLNDPSAVNFTNTFRNNSAVELDNIQLRPISAFEAASATDNLVSDYEIDAIPNGTIVTISVNWAGGTQTAQYTYDGTEFDLDSGFSSINLDNVPSGQVLDYTVTVELPAGTPQLNAYSIPIVAFVNNNPLDTFDEADQAIFNIKIDRLYTGYLKLTKSAKIFRGTTEITDLNDVRPGDIIEYTVTYTNISTPEAGTSTRILNANDVKVIEDGNSGTNNWATDIDNFDGDSNPTTGIDTSHVLNSATADEGTIQYFNNNNDSTPGIQQTGTNAASDVTRYENEVGTVAPSETGTFTFRRTIN